MNPSAQAEAQQVSLPQASQLLNSFIHFLTVCVHNILYYRAIYPPESFLTSRAYNLPVHQSRHPKVCDWVRDALDAVKAQLVLGTVERLAVVIYDPDAHVMERWMFDLASFPAWTGVKEPSRASRAGNNDLANEPEESRVNWTDIDEQLRAAVRRLAYAGEKLGTLPEGCTFTIAVELREQSEAPIGHPQPWIPTQPNLQTPSKTRTIPGEDVGGASTTPLRAVEAGPLFFECWVEEGKAKLDEKIPGPSSSAEQLSSGE